MVTSDVAEFRDAILRADTDSAVALHAGPFLDGFLIRDAETFEQWATATRVTFTTRYAEALEILAERAAARGDVRGAVEWWRRRQAADPLSGRVAIGLMRALDAAGDRAGALRRAHIHEALLRQETGASAADPLVADLAATLWQPVSARPISTVNTAAGELPEAASTSTGSVSHDRLSHDIRSNDAGFRARREVPAARPRMLAVAFAMIGVLAVWILFRNTARRDDVAIGQSARPLPTGRAATAPSAARPSVAVLPFANTSGDASDEPFADGLTDELISALGQVAALKVTLTTRISAGSVLPATTDLVAYELYLKGQFFRYQLNGSSLQRAVTFFEQALARDPGFARAHAGLADTHALLVLFGDRPPGEGFRRARASAVTALTLDSTLA